MTGGMDVPRAARLACSSSEHSGTSYVKKREKVPGEGQRRPWSRTAAEATGGRVLPKTFLLSGGKKGGLGGAEKPVEGRGGRKGPSTLCPLRGQTRHVSCNVLPFVRRVMLCHGTWWRFFCEKTMTLFKPLNCRETVVDPEFGVSQSYTRSPPFPVFCPLVELINASLSVIVTVHYNGQGAGERRETK